MGDVMHDEAEQSYLRRPGSWIWILVSEEKAARCQVYEYVVEGDPPRERLEIGGHGLLTFERPAGGDWECTHPPTAVGLDGPIRFESADPPLERNSREFRWES